MLSCHSEADLSAEESTLFHVSESVDFSLLFEMTDELLLLPPHPPLLHNFSHFAFTVAPLSGIVVGNSGSQPMNLYPFLDGSAGLEIWSPYFHVRIVSFPSISIVIVYSFASRFAS